MGSAALRTLLVDHQALGALTSLSIPAPLVMPEAGSSQGPDLICSISLTNGDLQIMSTSVAGSLSVHVAAQASSIWQTNQPSASPAPVTAARIGLASNSAALPAVKSAAIASLQSSTGRSGLWMDPAAFDCFLQLGQALMSDDNTEIYVPAGLGALQISPAAAELTHSDAAWASTLPESSAGALSSNFNLSSGAGQPVCCIAGLIAKSMGKVQSGTAGSSVATAQPVQCLYEVALQAVNAGQAWPLGSTLWRAPLATLGQPDALAASAIAAVQRLLKSAPAGASIQLQSLDISTMLGSMSGASSTNMLSGLIKTLSQESPQLTWSSKATDIHAPLTSINSSAPKLVQLSAAFGDAFGSTMRGGTEYAPYLLKSTAQEGLGPHHLMPVPRGSLTSLVPVSLDVHRPLKSDEVVLAIRAVGLNFR